jgi:hypothetical protein
MLEKGSKGFAEIGRDNNNTSDIHFLLKLETVSTDCFKEMD